VVFSGGGSLLLEPGRGGRSFKSTDAGRTWSSKQLTGKNNQQGEYLVRLRLGRDAAHGWAMSPVFDLWAARAGSVGTPGKLALVHGLADLARSQPRGTHLEAFLRVGSTPSPDAKTWTDWIGLDKDYKPDATTTGHRWAQLKLELTATRAQVTPRIPRQFEFAFELLPASGLSRDHYAIL